MEPRLKLVRSKRSFPEWNDDKQSAPSGSAKPHAMQQRGNKLVHDLPDRPTCPDCGFHVHRTSERCLFCDAKLRFSAADKIWRLLLWMWVILPICTAVIWLVYLVYEELSESMQAGL